MNNIQLQEIFEKFVLDEVAKSAEEQYVDMMATPYSMDGSLSAAFHLFQYAYRLGERNGNE